MEKEINHLGVSKEEDSCLEQATLQLHPMKKRFFAQSWGRGMPMFHSDLFASLCKSRKKGTEEWRRGERGRTVCGGIHTKIEREEERPVFLGTPLFVYL